MRYLFFIFFLSFAAHVFPPYLEGNYFESHGPFGVMRLHFDKDGTFTYSEDNCTGGNVGKGKYFIDKDSIHIRFTVYDDTIKTHSSITTSRKDNASGRWEFAVEVADDKKSEAIVTLVSVKDSSGKILRTGYTDLNGHTNIKLPDYSGEVTISVNEIGYEEVKSILQKPGSYSVKVKMHDTFGPRYMEAGTAWDYRMLELTKKKMLWENSYPEDRRNMQSKMISDTIELKRE
jgi:hypothetical protein